MKVGVYGTGTMASGIVQVIAQAGHCVVVQGRKEESLARTLNVVKKNLQRLVAKEKLTEAQSSEVIDRIATTQLTEGLKDCDLVIEAISEDMELKKEVFAELDRFCKPEAILATNSSSLSITEIASYTNRPEKVIGMHFFNPVPVLKLVEVIRGQLTADDTYSRISSFSEEIGKVPVMVNEAPGFLVNRLLIPMINEGIAAYAEGVATAEAIDEAMRLGANHPMGPLALADLIGLDVCLAIMEVLHQEFGEDKYRAHPLLKKMVRANLLGRKSGRGFYQY